MPRQFVDTSSRPEQVAYRRYQPVRAIVPRRRLRERLPAGPVRLRVVGTLLLGLLGFALAVSVHSQRAASQLATARPDDLVRILDDLDARSSVLRTQIAGLQRTRDQLSGAGSGAAVLAETRKRAADLGILAGTLAAEGPGLTLTINDPQHAVSAEVLVDVVEELRDAGAETLEVGGVRMGATSWIIGSGGGSNGGVSIDGHVVAPPYLVRAIGDPSTMEKALQIPGGVVDTVDARPGASAAVATSSTVRITSLRQLPSAGYAQPAH